MKHIAVIGLGLIGGSLAKTIKLHTDATVYGADINPATLQQALLMNAIDAPLTYHNLLNFTRWSYRAGRGGGVVGALLCWPLYSALGVTGGFLAVLLLAVLLLTATALAASAYFGGTLDWNGNFTPYTEEEYLDTLPDPTPRPDMSSNAAMNEILAGVPDGEYWQFRTESGGHGRFGSNMILFDSVRDMQSLLTGFDLPVPETGSCTSPSKSAVRDSFTSMNTSQLSRLT